MKNNFQIFSVIVFQSKIRGKKSKEDPLLVCCGMLFPRMSKLPQHSAIATNFPQVFQCHLYKHAKHPPCTPTILQEKTLAKVYWLKFGYCMRNILQISFHLLAPDFFLLPLSESLPYLQPSSPKCVFQCSHFFVYKDLYWVSECNIFLC